MINNEGKPMSEKDEKYWKSFEDTREQYYNMCSMSNRNAKRDPIIHRIKCDEPFFTEINEYLKTFELRLNDRGYRKDDFLMIERSQKVGTTKTIIYAHVTYILEGYPGIQPGYCIMGIDKLKEVELKNED